MGKLDECQAYRQHSMICANGFLQVAYCSGRVGCLSCGHVKPSSLPMCLWDELPDHYVDDSGMPLYSEAAKSARAALREHE